MRHGVCRITSPICVALRDLRQNWQSDPARHHNDKFCLVKAETKNPAEAGFFIVVSRSGSAATGKRKSGQAESKQRQGGRFRHGGDRYVIQDPERRCLLVGE